MKEEETKIISYNTFWSYCTGKYYVNLTQRLELSERRESQQKKNAFMKSGYRQAVMYFLSEFWGSTQHSVYGATHVLVFCVL